MPATELTEALAGAQRMRSALQHSEPDQHPKVTASFGVASLRPGESAAGARRQRALPGQAGWLQPR